MNMFLKVLFLLMCGWWLGCLGAFIFGGYNPSRVDIGCAMAISAMYFLTRFLELRRLDK